MPERSSSVSVAAGTVRLWVPAHLGTAAQSVFRALSLIVPLLLVALFSWATDAARAQESVSAEKLPPSVIDQSRVATDLDAIEREKGVTQIWSFNERAKSTLDAAPVPLFLPSEVVTDLAGGSEKGAGVLKQSGDAESESRIMVFENEYFVIRQFKEFRLTIHGTRQAFTSEGDVASRKAQTSPAEDYDTGFTATYSGGQVNFGYAGADYTAEFECPEAIPGCISEEKAVEVVKQLALCGTDGRCIDNGTGLIKK